MMRTSSTIITLTIVILFFSITVYSQLSERNIDKLSEKYKHVTQSALNQESNLSPKCALGTIFEILENFSEMSDVNKSEILTILKSPSRQRSKISGVFKIYFDTSGINTPSLLTTSNKRVLDDTSQVRNREDSTRIIMAYVDSTADIFNYVYNQIVNQMGYISPPFESGNFHYNVFITELGNDLYGQTIPNPNPIDPNENPLRYTSYVEIDNDYKDIYSSSRGLPGLRVTAAHEFHHVVQLGSYGFRNNDRYFYEITSTWIEDVIYDGVNDYYQYIKTLSGIPRGHFADPDASFIKSDGFIEYSRAIWGKYLENKFSKNIIKRIWELMRNSGNITATNNALFEVNYNFQQSFIDFSKWNYFTGSRSITGNYYPEASKYPLIEEKQSIELIGNSRDYSNNLETVSSLYLPLLFRGNQITSIISNLNITAASAGNIVNYPFIVNFTTFGDGTAKEIHAGLFAKFTVPDVTNWTISTIVGDVTDVIKVFPNPYISEDQGMIQFQLPQIRNNNAHLSIYTSDMAEIFSKKFILSTFEPKIVWDVKDNNGNIPGSGIYFFTLQIDGKEHVGKFAIIRK